MLLADKGEFAEARPADDRVGVRTAAHDRDRRMIAHGDSLFAPGMARNAAYRVETGALCHYVVWPDGSHDVIEFAFPGDIVGLGSLAEHVSTAQAMVDTYVAPITDAELKSAISSDAALAARLASATDREFDFLRRRALQPGVRPVINRLAAYLIAVAGNACRSGETHVAVSDESFAALSSLLGIPAAELRAAYQDLSARGLISADGGAIVITDFAALEALADA